MATFALTHDLLNSLKSSNQVRESHGSGASTPLFMPVAHYRSDGADAANDGAHTPVQNRGDFEMRFKAEVAALQMKLLELQQTTEKPGKDVLPPPPGLGLVMPPPGLMRNPSTSVARPTYEPVGQVSLGTVGHPFSCAAPCPHGRASCPNGARCQLCHECPPGCVPGAQPQPLALAGAPQQDAFAPPAKSSLGSVGHPYTCGNSCKYVKKKSGCRNGADCADCHLCHWQRVPLPKPPAPKANPPKAMPQMVPGSWCPPCDTEIPPPPVPVEGQAASETCLSVGSIGHPYTCGSACKYARKQRGCKDGKLCVCCHQCVWRRYSSKTAAPQDAHAVLSAPPAL